MLETIREYAKECLAELHDETEIRLAHATFFCDLAERAEPMVRGYDHDLWFPRLMAEHDNFHSALEWSLGGGDLQIGVRLVGALGLFWYLEGRHYITARRWVYRALEHIDHVPPQVAAMIYLAAGNMAWTEGKWTESNEFLEQAVNIFEELGDRRNYGWTLSLTAAAYTNSQKDYPKAVAICEESIAIAKEFDDRAGLGWAYNILGELTRANGDYPRAKEYYEIVLDLCRETGNRWRAVMQYFNLGAVAHHDGDYALAEKYFHQQLDIAIDTHNLVHIGGSLFGFAGVEAFAGDPERAVRIAGAAQAICDSVGQTHQRADVVEYDRFLAEMHKKVDDETFDRLWKAGYILPIDEAIAFALGATIN